MRNKPKVLKEASLDFVEIVQVVLVRHVCGTDVQLEIRSKIFKVIIVRQLYLKIKRLHNYSVGILQCVTLAKDIIPEQIIMTCHYRIVGKFRYEPRKNVLFSLVNGPRT